MFKEFLFGLSMPFTIVVPTISYLLCRLRGYDPYKVPSGNGAAAWMGLAHAAVGLIVGVAYLISMTVLVPLFGPLGFLYAIGGASFLCGIFMAWSAR